MDQSSSGMDIDSPENSTGSNEAASAMVRPSLGSMGSSTGLNAMQASASSGNLGFGGGFGGVGMHRPQLGGGAGGGGGGGQRAGPQEWEWLTMSL